jgi:hypothetical protein
MARIFGRRIGIKNPFCSVLRRRHATHEHRIISRNMRMDYRVSAERMQVFEEFAVNPSNACIKAALTDYHEKCVRGQRFPDFTDSRMNSKNIIFDRISMVNCFNYLARDMACFLNLNGLWRVFDWKTDQDEKRIVSGSRPLLGLPLEDFWPNPPTATEFADAAVFPNRLNQLLRQPRNHRRFVEGLCGMLNDYHRIKGPYYPKWATMWDEYDRVAAATPGAPPPPELLGVPVKQGEWVIAFRYQAREAPNVVRPTQLDAGAFPQHYPSPPAWNRVLSRGGAAMNLARERQANIRPAQEYIHTHVPLGIDQWDAAGGILLQAAHNTQTAEGDILAQRACCEHSFGA